MPASEASLQETLAPSPLLSDTGLRGGISSDEVVQYQQLEDDIERLSASYQSATPFPHIVIDEFLGAQTIQAAALEFPAPDLEQWNAYSHRNERKFSHTDPTLWGPTLQRVLSELNSDRFVALLSRITGIQGLFPDHSLQGGGLHQSLSGGFLNVHADFTVQPYHRDWRRRVNLLVYFNESWKPEYGGDLELWSPDMRRCERRVAPLWNRAVVFSTDETSFHGHPEPMTCPEGKARRSLALYYFTSDPKAKARSTEYRARPGDGLSSLWIYADKQLLRSYDWSKRHLGISDSMANRIQGKLERLRKKPRS